MDNVGSKVPRDTRNDLADNHTIQHVFVHWLNYYNKQVMM
jgi:hypothetical protein